MSLKRTALVLVAAVACESSPTPVPDRSAEPVPMPNALGSSSEAITRELRETLAILDEQVQMAEENLTAAQQRLANVRAAAADSSADEEHERKPPSTELAPLPPRQLEIARAERDLEIAQTLLRELKARQYETEVLLAWTMYGDALRATDPSAGSADSAGER
jgi:hypothetical protein